VRIRFGCGLDSRIYGNIMKYYQTLPIRNINILLIFFVGGNEWGFQFLATFNSCTASCSSAASHQSYSTICRLLPSNTRSKFQSPISQQHCRSFRATHTHLCHLWYHSGRCDPWVKPYIFTRCAASLPYFPGLFRVVTRSLLCFQLRFILHVPLLWRGLPTTTADLEKPYCEHVSTFICKIYRASIKSLPDYKH